MGRYKGYECKGQTKSGRKCETRVSGCNEHVFCEEWFCHHHKDQARDIDEIQREVTELKNKMENLKEEKEKLKSQIQDLKKDFQRNDPYI